MIQRLRADRRQLGNCVAFDNSRKTALPESGIYRSPLVAKDLLKLGRGRLPRLNMHHMRDKAVAYELGRSRKRRLRSMSLMGRRKKLLNRQTRLGDQRSQGPAGDLRVVGNGESYGRAHLRQHDVATSLPRDLPT